MENLLSFTCVNTAPLHGDDINSCDISCLGLLATGGGDHAVQLLRLQAAGPAASVPLSGPGHSYSVNCVRFSPHGTVLASASTDGTTVLWNSESGARVATLHQPSGFSVRTVAFCPGPAGLLATGGDDDAVVVWNISEASPVRTIAEHEGTVFALAFSSDGAVLATSDSVGRLFVWSSDPGHHELLAGVQNAHDLGVSGLDFSSASTQTALNCEYRFASCGRDGFLKVWYLVVGSTNSLVCHKSLVAHQSAAMCVRYSGHGRFIATSGGDKTCKVWSADSLACLTVLDGFARYVTACCFSSNDAFLVATSFREIKVWKVNSGIELATEKATDGVQHAYWKEKKFRHNMHSKQSLSYKIVPSSSGVTACDMHKNLVATASGGRDVRLWECSEDSFTESAVSPLVEHQGPVYSVRFGPSGLLVSASLSGDIVLWDPSDGAVKRKLDNVCHLGIRTVQISANFICCGGNDDTAYCFSLSSGKQEALRAHENAVLAVDFSADERWMATGCAGGRLNVWQLSENEGAVRAFCREEAHDLGLTCCSFHPGIDLIKMATGGNDSLISIWIIDQNRLVDQRKLSGHGGPVMCLVHSSDGRFLASSSGDKSARIWDSRSYACLTVLGQHHKYVSHCAFSGSESHLFVSTSENRVNVWKLELAGQTEANSPLDLPISDWTGD